MRALACAVTACLSLAAPTLSLASDGAASAAGEMPMVLTPARLKQPLSEVPAAVTIIDRELIEASGARELYQVLQLVPGMSAIKVDGNVPTVSYHGTQARDIRRMLVLVDGRSMYQAGLARVQWNEFPIAIEDVERIEVTRGPASAAYGANAFSAVINIITRHPRDMHGTTVATRQGGVADTTRNGVRDWRLTHANQRSDDAWRITVTSQQDNGYDAPFQGVESRDAKLHESFNLRYVHDLPAGSWEWLAGGSQLTLERPRNTDFDGVLDVFELPEESTDRVFTQLRWNHAFSESHQIKTQFYFQHQDSGRSFKGCLLDPISGLATEGGGIWFSRELRDFYEANNRDLGLVLDGTAFADPDVQTRYGILAGSGAGALCPEFRFDVHEQRVALEFEDTLVVSERMRMVTGAEIREDRVQSETYLDGTVTNVSGRVFGNLEVAVMDSILVNLGGYWEKDEINGRYASPRVAINWQFMPGHSLRVVRARSIRSMDIYEKRADVHLGLYEEAGLWASDPQALLGWSSPEFFVTQNSDGQLKAEEIDSRELSYFARVGPFEWDLRYFREELDNLVSGALNPFDFEPNNNGEVFIEGREAQISWRPHPAHLLRATGAHIHTSSRNPVLSQQKTERRLAAEDIASVLWRFDPAAGWMVSAAWYLAQDYNDFSYERTDAQLRRRLAYRGLEIELQAAAQHDIAREPVLFDENLYQGDTRYWLGLSLTL